MFKLHLVTIFLWILCDLAVGSENKTKETIYYKHTHSTAAAKAEPISKEIIPIVMEGQPPSLQSVKLNSEKTSTIREIVKKGSKIVPKKGVLLDSNEKLDQNGTSTLKPVSENPIIKTNNTSAVVLESNKQVSKNSSNSPISEKSSTVRNAPINKVILKQQVSTVTTTTARKPKPKPEVTIGEKEADEPIPASPTNKSPLGMPRKIDYIVPVVITVTALPLLGVAFYVLYKRGRDYWDKRHYRRMDFLIDGMYNE